MRRYFIIVCLFLTAGIFSAAVLLYRFDVMPMEGILQGSDTIELSSVGNPPKETYAHVKKAAEGFNDFLSENYGIRLSKGVRLYLTATDSDYRKTLEKEFRIDKQESSEIAKLSGGWSGGSQHITVINAAANVMRSYNDSIATTGHELFHQLQYELSKGKDTDDNSLFWLDEGSADYIGAHFAESLGGKSRERWIEDVKDELLFANMTAKPEEMQHLDLEARKKIMGKEYHSYQVADLMTWYLLTFYAKEDGSQKLISYYKALSSGKDGKIAFQEVFGVSLEEFQRAFSAYWEAEQKKRMQLSFFSGNVGKESASAWQDQFEMSVRFIEAQVGTIFRGSYSIYWAQDADDMKNILTKVGGVSSKDAAKFSARSLWFQNASTIVINTKGLTDHHQQVFTMGTLAMRLFLAQQMGDGDQDIAWLTRGLSYAMGTRRVLSEGYGTEDGYQRTWENELKQSASRLDLSKMETSEDALKSAGSGKDDERAQLLSELAVWILTKNGTDWSSALQWTRQVRQKKDKAVAFQSVYGISLHTFYAEMANRIR